jgi:Ni/Co efflux regulator RcnB
MLAAAHAAAEKEFAMNKPILAAAGALLLAGAVCGTAMAQDARYAYPDPLYANGDADNDSIPNAEDPIDDRYDAAGNPVRFEVGESLPADSYGNATAVDARLYRLRAAPAGQEWHHLGNNFYLIDSGSGRIVDAVYNKREP